MSWTTKVLTLLNLRIEDYIALDVVNKEYYFVSLTLTTFALIGGYKREKDFIGMDMARKFLEMGHTRARRYANHSSGKKYDSSGKVRPQEPDWRTSEKARAAKVFKVVRDKVAYDPTYQQMRKEWRAAE